MTVNLLATAVLAFSMSTDAFAVSIGKGAALHKPRFSEALRTGAIFGSIEAATPLIGWAIGIAASSYVAAIDHWIAFIVLGLIGAKMIYEGVQKTEDDEKPQRHGLGQLVLTAFATSIDSMAVGVTISILGSEIGLTAAAIGLATFLMVTIGMMMGQYVGARFGKIAELCGGAMLIFLGTQTLVEHLGLLH
ncbi:MAG: manganese efflux pump MntP family protein [Micavibrio sp.]|nr:manganese efflux pump MntP family protein [Micavibrio sp.]